MEELLGKLILAIIASSGIWTLIQTLVMRKLQKDDTSNQALKSLLRDAIYRRCEKALADGEVTINELENINGLYTPYKELGGNGTAKKLIEEVNDLHTEVRGLISAETEARTEADAKKVGYQEVQGSTLYMYTDDSKAVLLATLELPTAPVQDVQVAGASVVADGVANIPRGNDSTAGVIKPSYGYGTQTNSSYQLCGVER